MAGVADPDFQGVADKLEIELSTFSEHSICAMSHQLQAFDIVYSTFHEDDNALQRRSKQRRSEVVRARNLLSDVYLRFGSELFTLFAFALPISSIAKLKTQRILQNLEKWWTTIHQPAGLKALSSHLCEKNGIRKAIVSCQKRQFPGLDFPSSRSARLTTDLYS